MVGETFWTILDENKGTLVTSSNNGVIVIRFDFQDHEKCYDAPNTFCLIATITETKNSYFTKVGDQATIILEFPDKLTFSFLSGDLVTNTFELDILKMFEINVSKDNTESLTQGFTENNRPNLVFILTDNQAQAILGVYGNMDVKTPNIDRLASDGILFNNVFAANGMCSPTRATLMTGLLPSQHGVHNWLDDHNLEDWPENWSVVEEFQTLPLTLQNRGYDTAMIGKWHLGQPWESSIGYEHWITFTYGHTLDFWNNNVVENGNQYEVKDKHIVDFFTDKAVDYIESRDGKTPFYLQLNYDGPYTMPPTNFGPAKNQFYSDYEGMEFQ